jgi:hypothetical protein
MDRRDFRVLKLLLIMRKRTLVGSVREQRTGRSIDGRDTVMPVQAPRPNQ